MFNYLWHGADIVGIDAAETALKATYARARLNVVLWTDDYMADDSACVVEWPVIADAAKDRRWSRIVILVSGKETLAQAEKAIGGSVFAAPVPEDVKDAAEEIVRIIESRMRRLDSEPPPQPRAPEPAGPGLELSEAGTLNFVVGDGTLTVRSREANPASSLSIALPDKGFSKRDLLLGFLVIGALVHSPMLVDFMTAMPRGEKVSPSGSESALGAQVCERGRPKLETPEAGPRPKVNRTEVVVTPPGQSGTSQSPTEATDEDNISKRPRAQKSDRSTLPHDNASRELSRPKSRKGPR